MATTFHIACDDCRCLLPVEPLPSEAEQDLTAGPAAFGEQRLAILEHVFGADDEGVLAIRHFMEIHAGHRVILGSPEDGHGTGYVEGLRPLSLESFLHALDSIDPELQITGLGWATDLAANKVVQPVLELAKTSADSRVRQAAREALLALKNTKAVIKARSELIEIDRGRLAGLNDFERIQLLQLGVVSARPEHLDLAFSLVPDAGALRVSALQTLAWSGDERALALLIEQAKIPELLVQSATALGVLVTRRRFPRDALAVLFDVLYERARSWHSVGQHVFVPLLGWCGDKGRQALETMLNEAPPGRHRAQIEQVLHGLSLTF